ncbi:MAG: dethiobiotin synthase [Candidatus Microthrix parvicella]|nr:dethiobiotin synthase [Candidatus Microthrix parvicella]
MSQSTSAGARPKLLVACVGTATEVGKTWVGARTIEALRRRSIQVAARKPAESFAVDGHEPLDSEVLAHTSGEPAEQVTPPQRRYAVALAPPMAAQRLGLAPPLIAELLVELGWPSGCRVGWLETVGGVRSPVAADADSLGLCAAVDPDVVVLVGDASLGAIGAAVSAIDSITLGAPALADRTIVLMNRFDPDDDGHRENHRWLAEHLSQPVLTDIASLANRLADAVERAAQTFGAPGGSA